MFKDNSWKIILGVVVVLMAASFWWAGTAGSKANVGVEDKTFVKGNTEASVAIVEYSDFQCPACATFVPLVNEIIAEYGDQVSFEYRHFPLISIHSYAVPAALAAESAGQQDKFYEMHDLLFENQSVWSNSGTPLVYFNQYAEQLGLDVDLFKQHMRSSILDQKIEESFNEARELGLSGTPTFFLNGERMQFDTYEDFINQIEVAINGPSSDNGSTTAPAVDISSDVIFGV